MRCFTFRAVSAISELTKTEGLEVSKSLRHSAVPGTTPANMQLQIHSQGQLSPTVNVAGA
jgi:hypothetical protein